MNEIPSIKAEVDAIKRRRILDEAIRQFFDNGYEATSLESIAEALGVTKQFIYSRFRSKSDLLVSICKAGASAADETVIYESRLSGSAATKLALVIKHFVNLQISHRREVALFFREAKSLPPDKAAMIDGSKIKFHRMLCGILEEGKKDGFFRFEDTAIAASALGGMASWTFTWFQPEGRLDSDAVANQMAALALRTVGIDSPSEFLV